MNNNQMQTANNSLIEMLTEKYNKNEINSLGDCLRRSIIAIKETSSSNSKLYEKINQASNRETTCLRIVENASLGLVFGKDYTLTSYSDGKNGDTSKIVETVYGLAYKRLAFEYSTKKIKAIKQGVIFKGDDFKWDGLNEKPECWKMDLSLNRSNYDLVMCAFAYAEFETGETAGVVLVKGQLDRQKEKSHSTAWSMHPVQMIESKILRNLCTYKITMNKTIDQFINDELVIDTVEFENKPTIKSVSYYVEEEKPVQPQFDIAVEAKPEIISNDDLDLNLDKEE